MLVVVDQTLVRDMVAEALRAAGLRVTEAACAETALRVVAAAPGPPDVLVTDVVLGGGAMDGRALAAERRRRSPEVGAVYLAERPAAPAGDALDNREGWLTKPFEPARLAGMVCEMAPPCPKPPQRVRELDVVP